MAEDSLSQTEVDALLAAVEAGAAAVPPSAHVERRPSGAGREDLGSAGPVSEPQVQALRVVHQGVARAFGAALTALVRTSVEVQLVRVDQLTYGEFVSGLENPTCFQLLSVAPLEGNMALELSPSIVYPLLDRLLGGGRETLTIPKRPLTQIELRLVGRVTALALDALKAAWASIQPIDFQAAQTGSDPGRIRVVAAGEPVVRIGFELALGQLHGTMSLCIPVGVIEPIADQLSEARGDPDRTVRAVPESRAGATVEVVVHLAETHLSTDELANLQVGDILKTEKPAGGGLLVSVEGVPKFRARPGVWNAHKAVRITGPADHTARIN